MRSGDETSAMGVIPSFFQVVAQAGRRMFRSAIGTAVSPDRYPGSVC
jgi:hypothetical protein